MAEIISFFSSFSGILGAVKGIAALISSIIGFLMIKKAIKGYLINQSKKANEQRKVDQQNDLESETQQKGDQYVDAQEEIRKSFDG